MNTLEQAIKIALQQSGTNSAANKAYLEFIKANFFVPIEKNIASPDPMVLFLQQDDQIFLPVFTNMLIFDQWAKPIRDQIYKLTLSGINLLQGVGANVTVSLNIGSELYKNFIPAELARMRSMVMKLNLNSEQKFLIE